MWKDVLEETDGEISKCYCLIKAVCQKPDLAFSRAVELYEGLYNAKVLDHCAPMLKSGLKDFQNYQKKANAILEGHVE